MIASLRGTVTERGAGWCVLEAGGVGYLVQISTATAAALPAPGEAAFLRTRQVVREDAVQLFGFAEADELRLFDLMIGVSGVGPKLALAVLSGLRPAALARAIRDEQIGALVAIPGIGRKTAERLVVELRDKIEAPPAPAAAAGAPAPREPGGVMPRAERYEDAVAALVKLGYTAAQAQESVRRVAAAEDDPTVERLVRRSLALLTKPTVASR